MSFFGLGGDNSGESEDFNVQQQPQPQRPAFQSYPQQQQQLARPTNPTGQPMDRTAPTTEKFHRAIFVAAVRFTPRDMFKLDKNGSPVELLNDGKIMLSVADGSLKRIWCDHEKDFTDCDRAFRERLEATVMQAMQAIQAPLQQMSSHHGSRRERERQRQVQVGPREGEVINTSPGNTPMFDGIDMQSDYCDITQAIYVVNTTSSWPRALQVEFPSVKKYKDEGYANANVGVYFLPGILSTKQATSRMACERTITHGNLTFSRDYPNTTLASLDNDMSIPTNSNKAWLDFNSAFFSIYNSKKWSNVPYTQPTHKETHQVMMDAEHAKKWMGIVKNEIADYMCHGNITKNFQVELSVPMPHHREMSHMLFEAGHPDGVQFQGFGDKDYLFQGQNIKNMTNEYLDKVFEYNCEFHVSYMPGQQKPK